MAGTMDGPIKQSQIEWYAKSLELDIIEAEALAFVVQCLDAAHLTQQAKRASRAARRK